MPTNALPISEEDVRELETLLSDLKTNAAKANEEGNVILLSCYAELLKVVSPEVQRLRSRLDREERASINKAHRELRKSKRNGASPIA